MQMRSLIIASMLSLGLLAGCGDGASPVMAGGNASPEKSGKWAAPAATPAAGEQKLQLSGNGSAMVEILRAELIQVGASRGQDVPTEVILTQELTEDGLQLALPADTKLIAGQTYYLAVHYADGTTHRHPIKPQADVVDGSSFGGFICSDSSARNESLLRPKFFLVQPDASFVVPVKGVAPSDPRVTLAASDGREFGAEVRVNAGALEIVPSGPLARGESYTLTLRWKSSLNTIAAADRWHEQSVHLLVRRAGVVFAAERDFDGDFAPDRIAIEANGSVVMESSSTGATVVNQFQLREVADADVGDLNRDGFPDLILAGFDDELQPALEVLWNRSYFGEADFEAELIPLVRAASSVRLPVALRCVDLESDGWLDVLVAGFEGSFVEFRNALQRDSKLGESRRTAAFLPRNASIMSDEVGGITALEIADVTQDGHADVLVSGMGAGALIPGGLYGLAMADLELLDAPGAHLYPMRDGRTSHVVALSAWTVSRFDLEVDELQGSESWVESVMFGGIDQVTAFWCFNSADYDRNYYTDFALTYQETDSSTLHRWLQFPHGLDREGRGVRLGHTLRVNRVVYAPHSESLLLCAEDGLISVGLRDSDVPGALIDARPLFFTNAQPLLNEANASSERLLDLNGDGLLDPVIALQGEGSRMKFWLNRSGENGAVMQALDSYASLPAAAQIVAMRSANQERSRLLIVPSAPDAKLTTIEWRDGSRFHTRELAAGVQLRDQLRSAERILSCDVDGDGRLDLVFLRNELFISYGSETGFDPAQACNIKWLDESSLGLTERIRFTHLELAESPTGAERIMLLASVSLVDGAERLVLLAPAGVRGAQSASLDALALYNSDFDEIRSLASGEIEPGQRGYAALVRNGSEWSAVVWPRLESQPQFAMHFAPGFEPRGLGVVDLDGSRSADLTFLLDRYDVDGELTHAAMHLTLLENRGVALDGSLDFDRDGVSVNAARIALITQGEELSFAEMRDFNGDGRPDLLARTSRGQLFCALNE